MLSRPVLIAFTVSDRLPVVVVMAWPERVELVELEVPAGTTVRGAVERARSAAGYEDWDLAGLSFGVFGERCAPETLVKPDDRVEIYRPLVNDPKTLRRARAASQDARNDG